MMKIRLVRTEAGKVHHAGETELPCACLQGRAGITLTDEHEMQRRPPSSKIGNGVEQQLMILHWPQAGHASDDERIGRHAELEEKPCALLRRRWHERLIVYEIRHDGDACPPNTFPCDDELGDRFTVGEHTI